MRLLLDSHAVYWWMTGSVRLSDTARALIVDDTNTLLVSAVSIYEIELKAKRRRVDLPPQELRAALRRNIVEELAITHDHAEYAAHLEWEHRDPPAMVNATKFSARPRKSRKARPSTPATA